MSEVLIKELSNQDIDWMSKTGYRQDIEAGTVLVHQGQALDEMHILLDGELRVSLTQDNANPLGRAFAALEGGTLAGREIGRLHSGEIVGEIPFMETYLPSTTISASIPSTVLTIPKAELFQKLQEDISFAAHIHRASAMLLASRLQDTIQELGNSTIVLSRPQLREALIIFAELDDSDIDWLITAGRVQQFSADSVLIRSGRPIEALHILLDGAVVLNAAQDGSNSLVQAFANLEEDETEVIGTELGRLSRGDIIGETPFIEMESPGITVRALRDSRVLLIPRWRLSAKLLHDVGFAARFYRVLAIILADKQQEIVQRLGYGRLRYSKGESLEQSFANELNNDFLGQVAIAGARFEWMLKKIGVE
ncbi:MAG: cyclic nucleotide-binding domain-containing protein [Cyanobacteria bacterium P01_A01_bin.84]